MIRPAIQQRTTSHSSSATSRVQRRRRLIRPALEALEGRVVLNASLLDTTFGTGGVLIPPPVANAGQTSNSDAVNSAVQSTGKVVIAESHKYADGTSSLVVRRLNLDGSLDTTFGTNGQTIIPPNVAGTLPSGGVEVDASDNIVLVLSSYNPSTLTTTSRFVARLTSNGQVDTNFGTNGEVTLPSNVQSLFDTKLQSDGKILIASAQGVPVGSTFPTTYQLTVTRLTTTGALDTTFNGTGQTTFEPTTKNVNDYGNLLLALTPGGQIYLGSDFVAQGDFDETIDLTRINTNGTLDTTYGTGGTQNVLLSRLTGLGVQPNGKVVLVGGSPGRGSSISETMLRLNTDGSGDSTFLSSLTGTETLGIGTRFDLIDGLALSGNGEITLIGVGSLGEFNVARFLPTGAPDRTFGLNGLATIPTSLIVPASAASYDIAGFYSVTVTPNGDLLAAGSQETNSFLVRLLVKATPSVANDYDGDGRSDVAAYIPSLGAYAYRPSSGGNDVLTPFGSAGTGGSIPAPGDYDGDGTTDLAVYLTATGKLGYRPTNGGNDVLTSFGSSGAGNTIPAPGDYDGDGITDDAVYLPANGAFALKRSGGSGNVLIPFGQAGAGNSIPVPGDYDGDGVTDLAVYLPKLGQLIYRPSSGGKDVVTVFGQVGAGASIPVPGDYDGDGKTDIAVYIPSLAQLIYRPSSGEVDVVTEFGQVGTGASIPIPGDYDGDGKTDLAVYIPSLAQFIYRPSSGGSDVVTVFGNTGAGATIPAASIPYAQPPSGGGSGARGVGSATPSAAVYIPLTDDLTSPTTATAKKKTGATTA